MDIQQHHLLLLLLEFYEHILNNIWYPLHPIKSFHQYYHNSHISYQSLLLHHFVKIINNTCTLIFNLAPFFHAHILIALNCITFS